MDLGDLGTAIGHTEIEGLASSRPSLPLPPHDPSLPPPPAGRGDDAPPPPSDEPSQPRSTVAIALALVLTVLVGAGAFALVSWARDGTACSDADFRSARFGYCTSTPAGWVATAAQAEGTPLDRFMLQDGPAVITVIAVPLTKGQNLARFEQFVRGYDEDTGATTSGSAQLEVDGVDAVAFEVTLAGPEGDVRSREVLFARDGIAWRVTLADESVGFEASANRLGELLDSWRFI